MWDVADRRAYVGGRCSDAPPEFSNWDPKIEISARVKTDITKIKCNFF